MEYICKVSCATARKSFIKGETVEINDEVMAEDLVNAGFMEPVEGETVEEKADTLNTAALENKKVSELKDICKNLGLETEGTKKELIEAIKGFYNGND